MSAAGPEPRGATAEGLRPEETRGIRSRSGRLVVRWLVWSGLGILAVGLVVAFLAQGPSVLATVVLSVGMLTEAAGLVAYRILFWASVYAKDKPKAARRVRKPGA